LDVHILGVKVTYHDIEAIDPDYYKNLKWMLEVGYMQLSPPLFFSHIASLQFWLGSICLSVCLPLQNDISDVLHLTFSIDADEEKLILYERTEVRIFLDSSMNFGVW